MARGQRDYVAAASGGSTLEVSGFQRLCQLLHPERLPEQYYTRRKRLDECSRVGVAGKLPPKKGGGSPNFRAAALPYRSDPRRENGPCK
jgi:hypothetical protein